MIAALSTSFNATPPRVAKTTVRTILLGRTNPRAASGVRVSAAHAKTSAAPTRFPVRRIASTHAISTNPFRRRVTWVAPACASDPRSRCAAGAAPSSDDTDSPRMVSDDSGRDDPSQPLNDVQHSRRSAMAEKSYYETFTAQTEGVINKIKALIHEGNVRRVVVQHQGRTVAEFP